MKLSFSKLDDLLGSFQLIDADRVSSSNPSLMLIVNNIRTFKDWNLIPCADLNIFTGPNSSGKSTIIKILQLLSAKEPTAAFDMSSSAISTIGFTCSWDQFSNLGYQAPLLQKLFSDTFVWDREKEFNGKPTSEYLSRYSRFTWLMEFQEGDFDLCWGIYIFGDKKCIGQLAVSYEDGFLFFNAAPELYQDIKSDKFNNILKNAITSFSDVSKQFKPNFHKSSLHFLTKKDFNKKQPKYVAINTSTFDFDRGPALAFDENWEDIGEKRDALIILYSWFYRSLYLVSWLNRSITTIPPVRSVPLPEDLIFADDSKMGNKEKEWSERSIYQQIAEALKKNKSEYLLEVNQWLTRLLKIDCSLGGKVSKVIDPEPKYYHKTNGSKIKIPTYSIELYLIVQNGVRVGYNDVGTGVSQVVPVVALLLSLDGQSAAILQQPELHLHPRAQSILADLLIETVCKNNKLTIETHSEHIILRIIRRVFEHSSGSKSLNKITPHQIRLVYFEATPKGTEPHWIRIDDYGDFIDPWPSGFFEERYEDLFISGFK
jgi:hypothetical protein